MTFTKIKVFIYDEKEYKKYKSVFDGHPVLQVCYGNVFNESADCFITCGQSYGMMDGGIDGHTNYFFDRIERRVQDKINTKWRGELPVGASIVLATPTNAKYKHLCYAPTMRVPMNVAKTNNAYLAMRGALVECSKKKYQIKTIVVPLLCRGVGRMPCKKILDQILHAYNTFVRPTPRIWKEITKDADVLDVDYSQDDMYNQ